MVSMRGCRSGFLAPRHPPLSPSTSNDSLLTKVQDIDFNELEGDRLFT
jgi:hypothetical protein